MEDLGGLKLERRHQECSQSLDIQGFFQHVFCFEHLKSKKSRNIKVYRNRNFRFFLHFVALTCTMCLFQDVRFLHGMPQVQALRLPKIVDRRTRRSDFEFKLMK